MAARAHAPNRDSREGDRAVKPTSHDATATDGAFDAPEVEVEMQRMQNPVRRPLARLLILAVVLAALFGVGKLTGIVDRVNTESIRASVETAGPWGFLLFIAVFALGELVHVPGMVFVAAAILAYGRVVGFTLALVASIIAVSVSFLLVRAIGGRAIAEIERPL
jgi:hypothetical protein